MLPRRAVSAVAQVGPLLPLLRPALPSTCNVLQCRATATAAASAAVTVPTSSLTEGMLQCRAALATSATKSLKKRKLKSPKVLDGLGLAARLQDDITARTKRLFDATGHRPGLAVVLVGTRPDSVSYVKKKTTVAEACGFNSIAHDLPETTTQEELLELMASLDEDDSVDGILVQLPLPSHISQRAALSAVSPEKDVDGFHPLSMGRLARHGEDMRRNGLEDFEELRGSLPCTPSGCIALLEDAHIPIASKHAVVIGHSNIVGLPMALMLLHKNATVTTLHADSDQDELPDIVRLADIVVVAVGIPEFVKGSWLKPGAVVIDVGINFKDDPTRKSGRRMCGDVEWDTAEPVVSRISPVPGGVGPMTVIMLMQNVLDNACKKFGEPL